MDVLSWVVLGLLAGALAKWLMPGRDGGGWIATAVLGVAGAYFGGWAGSFIDMGTTGGLSIASIATATAGAFLLLAIYRIIKK